MTDEFGLHSLISPLTNDEFLEGPWPFRPFVAHDLKETLAEITALPFMHSLEALLNTWKGKIQVHLPDVRDESSAIDADSETAKKLYANGMALLFNRVDTISPELTSALESLRIDLGLPTSTFARCMAYATPSGKGTAPHFDQNANFVLQLVGTKKWWIAPNFSVVNPTQRHVMGQEIDPELASYAEEELPTEMPQEREEVILKPGSMLFVPRGYWHSTEAEGEALALNFTFSQPTYADLFLLALRSRLQLSPDWRELANGVTSIDKERRQSAQKKLDSLLFDLVQDVPHWRAEDILGATEGDFE